MGLSRRHLLSLGLLALPFRPSLAAAQSLPGRLIRYPLFPSAHVQPRQVVVWLPADYERNSTAYRVIYMQDGQNLFDPQEAYGGNIWGVAEALSTPDPSGHLHQAIVVGIYNTPLRHREYMPQALYRNLPDRVRARFDAATGGPPLSNGYVRFLADELKPFIDRTFRTDPRPDSNSLMGSSMGGLISFYGLMERPDSFGRAACLSPHWPIALPNQIGGEGPTPEEVLASIDLYLNGLGPDLKGRSLYLDRGDQTLDAAYPPFHDPIVNRLKARRGLRLGYRTFPGAAHNEQSWRARLNFPLGFLLSEEASLPPA